jgi:hypothetical protein
MAWAANFALPSPSRMLHGANKPGGTGRLAFESIPSCPGKGSLSRLHMATAFGIRAGQRTVRGKRGRETSTFSRLFERTGVPNLSGLRIP